MEIFLNEEKLDVIEYYFDCYPLDGITTNPKMIGSLGKVDYKSTLQSYRKVLGDKKLFTQVTSPHYEEILKEAEFIRSVAGEETYIKIPVNEVGIKAIRTLKESGYNILGTLCFNTIQAVMALQAGADYVAVLYNYMVNAGYDAAKTMCEIATHVKSNNLDGKLMGVGVRTMQEFGVCIGSKVNAINLNADSITQWIMNEPAVSTTKSFIEGWERTWGLGSKIFDFINF